MVEVDTYIEEVIKKGDRGSNFLGARIAGTLKNSPYVSVEGKPYSLVGLRVPRGYCFVVHSHIGTDESGLERKAESLVNNLVEQSMDIKAIPIGFANIIDSQTGDDSVIHPLGYTLERVSNERRLVMLNGENAILGNRVVGDANISGTMISIVDTRTLESQGIPTQGIYHGKNGNIYSIFPSTGEFVFTNSDGVGTKHEFYERMGFETGAWTRANRDWIAMVADDAVKNGGRIVAASGIYEHSKNAIGLVTGVPSEIGKLCEQLGFMGSLQTFPGNIRSYRDDVYAFNIGGSVVSIIDNARLNNMPVPHDGDSVIAIRGKPNPRSNGITAKREAMIKLLGEEWHNTPWGKIYMEFLGEPSTILYPVINKLLQSGLASAGFHQSGGALDGKFARPLAKFGLHANLFTGSVTGLYSPDWRENALASISSRDIRASYGKFPNGNDGFVTTISPEEAVSAIQREGLEARVAGTIEKRDDGKTGVTFTIAFKDLELHFSGKRLK